MLKYKRNMRGQPEGCQSAVPREADRIYGSPEGKDPGIPGEGRITAKYRGRGN